MKSHWFGSLVGQDWGLIECDTCYLIVEARRLKEFAGGKCPNDKATNGYNWWASTRDGLYPILAIVNLGQKLKCKFDVAFDAGAYEQAWAVQKGLTDAPTV